MSLPGCATPSEAYSVDSAVRIEASPAATDSEVHVQTGDFSSGEVATVSDDLPSKPDLRFYPDAMVLTENPAASAPALRKGGRRSIEVRLLGGYRSYRRCWYSNPHSEPQSAPPESPRYNLLL